MPRFWDVDEGRVLIGGVDVRGMDPHDLMDRVAFVFQANRLFKQSIFENVRAARPDAYARRGAGGAARSAVRRHHSEAAPGHRYRLWARKALYLSGGEAQRLMLARAILKDADVVVLDEATAFADPENEARIQKAFSEARARERTVLMVAHRLSTVRNADQIVVLDAGRVAEQGTHDELLAAGGLYARMWADYEQAVSWKISSDGRVA